MEYFEICKITPNIQCHHCPTYWPKGIVYCTCGTCFRPSDKVRKLNSDRNDVLSIPKYVIKKGPPMGGATGTRKDRESTIKPMSKVKGCKSIRDTFLRRPIYRQSQLNIGWTEEHCARLHEIAAETILTLLRRPNEHDAKTLIFSCLTVQDQTDP